MSTNTVRKLYIGEYKPVTICYRCNSPFVSTNVKTGEYMCYSCGHDVEYEDFDHLSLDMYRSIKEQTNDFESVSDVWVPVRTLVNSNENKDINTMLYFTVMNNFVNKPTLFGASILRELPEYNDLNTDVFISDTLDIVKLILENGEIFKNNIEDHVLNVRVPISNKTKNRNMCVCHNSVPIDIYTKISISDDGDFIIDDSILAVMKDHDETNKIIVNYLELTKKMFDVMVSRYYQMGKKNDTITCVIPAEYLKDLTGNISFLEMNKCGVDVNLASLISNVSSYINCMCINTLISLVHMPEYDQLKNMDIYHSEANDIISSLNMDDNTGNGKALIKIGDIPPYTMLTVYFKKEMFNKFKQKMLKQSELIDSRLMNEIINIV